MTKFPLLSRAALEAYDHVSVPVWVFSVDTLTILSANAAAQDWVGYDLQTLQAMTIADLRPEADRARIADQVRLFHGTKADAGMWTILTKAGDHHTASFTWSKVTFEGAEAIVASIRDVTQMTRAAARAETLSHENATLRRSASLSAAHLSTLFDGLPGKMLVLTPGEYRIVAVTDEYAHSVMMDRDALQGGLLFDLFPDDPAEPQADGAAELRASLNRVESLRVTDHMNLQRYPVRQPDGVFQERFWLPRNKPVLDADGQIIYIVHRVEDMTPVLAGEGALADGSPDVAADNALQVSEVRTALFALQEREKRLKTAETLLDLGAWEYEFKRGAFNWSDRVFDIYGVPRHGKPRDLDDYVALVHPEDREQMLATYTRFFETGAPEIEFQHRIIRANGTVSHIRGVGARHQVDDREIVIGFVQDITATKVNEEELLRQSRLRKFAGRLAHLGSWQVDLIAGSVTWDDEAAAIHDEPEGTSPKPDEVFAYCIPEHRAQVRASFEAGVKEGRPLDDVFQIRTAKGRTAWVHALGEAVRDDTGKVVAIEGAIQDITALKLAEEELVRQARQRRFAGRLARLGSWRVDLDDAHIAWDEETAAIHDEPEGFSPTLDRAIAYYIPEHRERIRAQFDACAREGRPFDDTCQIQTAKGRRVWVHALGEPIRDASGEIVAVEGAFQDITDLIAVQDAASELSARLRRTLEGMSDAFFLLDDAWQFAFVNSKAEGLLQRSKDDLLGKNVWKEFPDAVGSMFQTSYERAVSEGCAVRFQEYFPPLETWFEVSADPTPAGLAVYFRDVTLQRARDTQLRLLEKAVAHLNDILLITEAEPFEGPDGPRIVYVNDAFEKRTGFSREEVIGLTPRILQGPNTDRAELDRIRRALEKWRPVRSELINYTKTGEEFWIELDIVPLADETGWFTHWIAVERDITARKQADLALQANEERFRLVTKAAGSAIWDWNATTGEHWWSDGLRDIFGHEAPPFASMTTLWRTHVHPDDLPDIDTAIERLVSGQDNILRAQYRFRRADGSWATVEDNAFALHDDDGKVLRVLGSMTDTSQQKLLEDRLRQAQKMETVGQLTGGVAHDFNNLLTVILGNAEILDDELQDLPHLQRLAKMSLDAAERGADLTNRLLAFSRKQTLEPKTLDVAQLVQGMDGLLRRTLPETIEIEIVRAGGLWKIEADAAQLESALLNLAVNARDAMPEGGNLTIEMANAMLDDDYVALEPDVKAGQYVVIVVTDTGDGIPPHVISRVFEPFFTTKEAGKGSGLGLSMVFGFVKQSGGHIRIYSEMREGTAIKMYFPRSLSKKEDSVMNHTGRKVTGGEETILVVEDDGAVREYVAAQLQSLGYHVLQASAGAEAMEILHQTPAIDLLFTDVVMPGGMGGRELSDAARKLRPDLKVLFTSGYTENSIVHHGRLDAGVKLLSKPYRREQLAAKVREVLEDEGPGARAADSVSL